MSEWDERIMPEAGSRTITVVIPTYNGIKYIPDCLDSLKGQLRRPDEIIVVDDGSTDETASLIARSYPEVRLIRLESNRGFATAINEGIRRCQTDHIALLNNDARAEPQWLSELARTLDEQPSTGSCSSKMLFANRPDIVNSIGIGFTRAGTAFDVGYGQKDGEKFNYPRPIFGACAGAALYRRKLFQDVGLFDEDLFMWYEDADLSFRAQLAGYRCLYVPTARVYHVGGGTASPADRLHVHYCSRNQILILAKNLPAPLRALYFRRLLAVCFKHSLKTLLTGNLDVAGGYLAALRDLNHFLKKGKLNPPKTMTSADDIYKLLNLDSGEGLSTRNIPSVSGGTANNQCRTQKNLS